MDIKDHFDNVPDGEQNKLHLCVKSEARHPEQQYRRVQFTRLGYAVVPANSDAETLEAVQKINPNEIEWEPIKRDLLDDFEIIEVVGPVGESISE